MARSAWGPLLLQRTLSAEARMEDAVHGLHWNTLV